ncbi:hypothetical protein, conserved [Eimeria necatrix]|uniref:Ribosomal protein L46 N-terminal domain-containing protein n=1 Tax=Eimeria necatrix TaxID=51315 RepID=U6N4M5_9EIME|nr:hypothetical protein, conserved [Eimeria necatrix]CDJ70244.1 hypothetical protein, conserved [Eimeria necatrix]
MAAAAVWLHTYVDGCRLRCSGNFLHTAAAARVAGRAAKATAGAAHASCQRQLSSASASKTAATLGGKSSAGVGLLRAATLLLNNPPPHYEVSVHKGLKVQASLLLQRLPLVYKEPKHEQEFRLFKEEWERRTNNSAILGDEITYMQLPGHFLETRQQQQQREQKEQRTGDAQMSELDMLLQQEGLVIDRHKMRRQRRQHQDNAGVTASASAAPTTAAEREDQSLSQLPERVLLLLVKYGHSWQLPVEDRRQGQTMRQTLARLCMKQLGLREAPFMVGFSPAAVRHIRNKPGEVIQGREVFYYRAYHVPEQPQVCLPADSPVRDWAWVTAEEARRRMPAAGFAAVRDSLLLG